MSLANLAMNTHDCELIFKNNGNLYKSSQIFRRSNFRDTWSNWCSVSKSTPKTDKYFTSMAAIAAERRRHSAHKYWWIIHPFSYIRFLWDTLMSVVLLIGLMTIPFMISFVVMDFERIRVDKVNFPIYLICCLDIVINCLTGYHDKKNLTVEFDPAIILKYYLKKFLLLDLLSSLPYDHVTLPWRRLPGNDSYHIITILNILPLLKLSRYPTLKMYSFHLFTYLEIKNLYYQMYNTLLLAFYLLFWFSCVCYLVPVLVMHFINISECPDCWVADLEGDTIGLKFQHALFIVLENLSASGYGLFVPRTDGHVALSGVLTIIGRLLECYIIIMFLQIKAGSSASKSKFQEIKNQLLAYTRQKQLPTHMTRRLLAYYHYRFKDSYFREKHILSNLSEQLRQEIALLSCRRLVENVTIFKNLPKHILQSIVRNLKFELYLPNDVIAKAGTQGDCMYFLSTGTVAVLTPTGKEICHLDDGAHFGEVALLVPDQRRVASVISVEVCEVYRLDRKDFRKCIVVHSELFAKIEQIAAERVERALVVEEQHKRHLMRSSYTPEDTKHKKKRRRDT